MRLERGTVVSCSWLPSYYQVNIVIVIVIVLAMFVLVGLLVSISGPGHRHNVCIGFVLVGLFLIYVY